MVNSPCSIDQAAVRSLAHFLRARVVPQRGFAFMALIVFFGVLLAVGGIAMMTGATLQRRTSEEQLIFVGGEFRRAIESYYNASASMPPGSSRYPQSLDDLLADPRTKTLSRHLRQIYPDPLTGQPNWGTVPAPGGGIMGVYSLSPAKAVKLFGFPAEFKYLEGKKLISEWKFLYIAPTLPAITEAAAVIGGNAPAAAATPATPTSGATSPSATPNAATPSALPVLPAPTYTAQQPPLPAVPRDPGSSNKKEDAAPEDPDAAQKIVDKLINGR